jgi:hypothetical protein
MEEQREFAGGDRGVVEFEIFVVAGGAVVFGRRMGPS